MPRRPRIEIAGFYHIVNKGVERRVVFYYKNNFEYFINGGVIYKMIIYVYCTMDNHSKKLK